MAAANPGGPVRNPGQGSPSTPGGSNGYNPATAATETLDNYFTNHFPHSSDHGRGIFQHVSTNRGGTPGTLNGLPERAPGGPSEPAGSLGAPKNKTPGRGSTGPLNGEPERNPGAGPTRMTTPINRIKNPTKPANNKTPRRVDIPMPPTLTGDTSGTPGQSRAGY